MDVPRLRQQTTAGRLRDDVTGPAAFEPAALSSDTIDGLLDGGAVKDLPDGVRLRPGQRTSPARRGRSSGGASSTSGRGRGRSVAATV